MEETAPAPIRVLLVEDEPLDAAFVQRILGLAPPGQFAIVYVDTLAATSTALATRAFDVVLLDLLLPDSTGLATLAAVHTQAPTVPIVVLTILDDEGLAIEAVRNGAQDYLIKGQSDHRTLVRCIRYAVERGRIEAAWHAEIAVRKQVEERMRAAERLSALGRVAAGMAHEFNNILAGIGGRLDLLALERPDPATAASLDAIQRVVADGAALVRRIQTFARLRDFGSFTTVPVAELVESAVAQTRPHWQTPGAPAGPSIAVHTELEYGLLVLGNPDELQEAVANLILNAVEALPGGGQIAVTVERQAGQVAIAVRDSGPGIAPDVQDRIFEPFYTTKPSGSGLGLAVVRDIMQGHGGQVAVASSPGAGATFTLTLPLFDPTGARPAVSGGSSGLVSASGGPASLDLTRLGHDLRAPLTYLVGYAELLATRDLPPARVKQLSEEMLQQAELLAALVDRLQNPPR